MYLRELVATPRPLLAPFGLVNSQTKVPVRGNWENGIAYEITTDGLYARVSDACDYTAQSIAIGNAPGSAGALNTAYSGDYAPFVIEATDGCRSSIGMTVDERRVKALDALELLTPKAVERQFWDNGFTGGVNSENNFALVGSGATVLLGGVAVPARRGIAALEQALADTGAGTLGAIHVTRDVFSVYRVDFEGEPDGDTMYAPGGNMLVGGVGYPGTGPTGQARTAGNAWAYATGPVSVHLGPAQVAEEPSKITGPVGVESFHTNNTLVYTAERFAAVTVNGTKVFAVLIDLDG